MSQDPIGVMSSSKLDRFLVAYANRGWPECKSEYERWLGTGRFVPAKNPVAQAITRWLHSHKTFKTMIPNYGTLGALSGNVLLWQRDVQMVFARGKEPEVVNNLLTMDIAHYGSLALAQRDPRERSAYLTRIMGRMLAKKKPLIGLRPDGFLQALRREMDIAPRMRVCKKVNCGCRHPFFLAKRSSDVYCSKECSQWGKREAKRKSWNQNWKRWPSTRWRAKGGRKKLPGKGKRQ